MLIQHLAQFAGHRVVLASASPRRHELLHLLGLQCEIVPSTFAEDLPHSDHSPVSYVKETAREKTLEVSRRLATQGGRPPKLIIGADTVVEIDGEILEKPADDADAIRMLTRLSGRQHLVHTGVVLLTPLAESQQGESSDASERIFSETTQVQFDNLTNADIQAYVATGDYEGKAGAYGIQTAAAQFVRSVVGCYFNVMGFPINAFSREIGLLIESGKLQL